MGYTLQGCCALEKKKEIKKPSVTTGPASKQRHVSFRQTRPDPSSERLPILNFQTAAVVYLLSMQAVCGNQLSPSATRVLGIELTYSGLVARASHLAVWFPILEHIWVGPRAQSQRDRERHNSWSSWGTLPCLSACLCQGQDCSVHTGPALSWFPALAEGSFCLF